MSNYFDRNKKYKKSPKKTVFNTSSLSEEVKKINAFNRAMTGSIMP